ncbi:MAG: YhfC family intramembrane metalloprotease [Lachnospiraceae bacterium]|nr:YhfC family intramembrane metalloprotease [Lachnospiraceae bacterium]
MEEIYNKLQTVTVPSTSIACMIITGLLSVAVPVLIAIYLRKKYNCNLKCFLIGALVWIVFARLLETAVHYVVLFISPAGATIQGNLWIYALYGGLMAGLFEEIGRFVGMKFFLKDCMDNDRNSLMYGAGHGGMEAIIAVGLAMLQNIAVSLQINNRALGPSYEMLKTLPEEQGIASLNSLFQLVDTEPYLYFMGMVERIPAIAFHIALSVLVWKAVKESKVLYLILAIFFHFLLDAAMILVADAVDNIVLIEGFIYAMSAVLICVIVLLTKKKKEVTTI